MFTNEDKDAFKNLADFILSSGVDFSDPQLHWDLIGEVDVAPHQVRTKLLSLVKDTVIAKDGEPWIGLRAFSRAMHRDKLYLDCQVDYHQVPDWLLFGVNHERLCAFSEVKRWHIVLRAIYSLATLPYAKPDGTGLHGDKEVSAAAGRLRDAGYGIILSGTEFHFEEGELERACKNLRRAIEGVGGAAAVYWMLNFFHFRKRFRNDRYMAGRESDAPHGEQRPPSYPYGFILNLAAQYYRPARKKTDWEAVDSLMSLSRDLVAVLDVEDYSQFATIFTDHSNLPRYVGRLLLADSCLSFRQAIATDLMRMLPHLFNWINNQEMKERLGWDINDAMRLFQATFGAIPAQQLNTVIEYPTLARQMGCSVELVRKMTAALCHNVDSLNSEFLLPTDGEKSTFHDKPFIWQPGDKMLLISPPISSIGMFEGIAAAARALYPKTDNQIGLAIEPMLGKLFQEHGIEPAAVSAKYKIGKKTHECDLCIETDEAIILFEIKKKSLTRSAMSGHTLDGFIDLSKSLIKSQVQLSHHELELLSHGFIKFNDGTTINLKGKRIERVAVTLLDWGSLQDRTVADNILKTLSTSQLEYSEANETQIKNIDELNGLLSTLNMQTKALQELRSGDKKQPYFDCVFFGIPQLIFLLKGVSDAKGFYANLKSIKHMAMPSLDMFSILAHMGDIKAQAALESGASA